MSEKRPREEIEDESILDYLDGDRLLTEEQKLEEQARRRREARRRRLEQLKRNGSPIMPQHNNREYVDAPLIKQHNLEKVDDDQRRKFKQDEQPDEEREEDDDDEFDMFSSSVSPILSNIAKGTTATTTKMGIGQEDWDDAEGYYKAVIGEVIDLEYKVNSIVHQESLQTNMISFRVLGMIGKGVFSNVLKCSTISNSSSIQIPPTVAVKVIRNNETMAKAAMNEVSFLQRLKGSPGIVPLLLPTSTSPMDYKGHVILVFSYMEYNLRDVLHKYGKNVGLSLQAVRSYFGQLLAAATHLKKYNIIHADIKPDNILVSSDYSVVKIADMGSAIDVNSPEGSQVTPYLVSRFYRAPEIILGLPPTFAIDIWSIAVTAAEMFLGDVVFRGKSNNDMLYSFMQHLGPFSNRTIRQHLVQCGKLLIPKHFQQECANYLFIQKTIDPVTNKEIYRALSLKPQNENNNTFPSATPLSSKLLKAKSATDSRYLVLQFSELLQKCLSLDPARRITISEALQHPFFQPDSRKN